MARASPNVTHPTSCIQLPASSVTHPQSARRLSRATGLPSSSPLPLKPTLLDLHRPPHKSPEHTRGRHRPPTHNSLQRTQPSRAVRLRAPDHARRGGLERAPARAVKQAGAQVRRGGTRHRRRVISPQLAQTLRHLFSPPPAAAGTSQPCGACDQRAPKHTSNGMGGDPAFFWSSLAVHEPGGREEWRTGPRSRRESGMLGTSECSLVERITHENSRP